MPVAGQRCHRNVGEVAGVDERRAAGPGRQGQDALAIVQPAPDSRTASSAACSSEPPRAHLRRGGQGGRVRRPDPFAFSVAFKRVRGAGPSDWRRGAPDVTS